jgi:hypothetical protein
MKKFIVDLNFPITKPDGTEINPSASKLVSDLLSGASLKDESKITKFYSWAQDLGLKKMLELDEADHKTLKDYIKDHEGLFVIAKYPILQAFSQPPAPGTGGGKKEK